MPTNNFKLFDQNKANLLSDTEYANATQRLNGVQTGVASSQLQNKFAYQVSLVAYAIAQIMNQNGLDASDTLAVSAFVGNLQGAILQKVADRASSAEAAAGVLANKYISPSTMKAAALLLSGGVMNGTLDMNKNQIINLPTPTFNSEPATKGYVDGKNFVEKRLIFNQIVNAEANTLTKLVTNLSFDEGSDLKGISIHIANINNARTIYLIVSSNTQDCSICVSAESDIPVTSTIMFQTTSCFNAYIDESGNTKYCKVHGQVSNNGKYYYLMAPYDKSSNYYTFIQASSGSFNSNVKIWGLF